MKAMNDAMQQAMRLMRSGDLLTATRALRQRLAASAAANDRPCDAPFASNGSGVPVAEDARCIDGEFRIVDRDDPTPATQREHAGREHAGAAEGTFRSEHFACSDGAVDYKLYVPPLRESTRAPLLLMLHGCTQSPDDFARGTRMNVVAREHGYVVAYPQQSTARNRNRCWNWFRGNDQQRGKGEPAMLAALTCHLVARHGLDARRVYVAGLSAGGAMAAILADTHPDIYAAIGVHSGLPIGLASDVPSAFAAMRSGKPSGFRHAADSSRTRIPAIVFHGDGDTTVHPHNGLGVVAQSLDGIDSEDAVRSATTVEHGVAEGGRRYTRTRHLHDGRVRAEHWVMHGGAHAWSGGDPEGSYTDPTGPDASMHMLRFFATCAQPAA